jgi:hypothetical protein
MLIDYTRFELATEVNSATDSLESWEAVNSLQVGIVRHLETAVDLDQLREGDLSHIHVADEGQAGTDVGEVGGGDRAEVVAVEAKRAIERGE